LNNNILPMAWAGPGTSNVVTNPLLRHIPTLAETVFTNWAGAQIYREWFSLQPGSPGIGTGPNGQNKGGVIPLGASISGEPPATTDRTNITLLAGVNRTGFGIPASGWPSGSGYTHYRFRVNGGAWSTERSILTPMLVSVSGPGSNYVEVVGKRDSGLYQDDPRFGSDAIITRSDTWVVEQLQQLRIASAVMSGSQMHLQFPAHAGDTYTVQFRNALDSLQAWTTLTNVPAQPADGPALIIDPATGTSPTRFYRVRTPALP
jgi:hypothetical protein